MTDLLPCPFCNCPANVVRGIPSYTDDGFRVQCSRSHSDGHIYPTERAAIAAWNTRTPPKVKALEWSVTSLGFKARGLNGTYEVDASVHGPHWLWRAEDDASRDQYTGKAKGSDEAKAAAQADYEHRILSALDQHQEQPDTSGDEQQADDELRGGMDHG